MNRRWRSALDALRTAWCRDDALMRILDEEVEAHLDMLIRFRAEHLTYEGGVLQTRGWELEIVRFINSRMPHRLKRADLLLMERRLDDATARIAERVARAAAAHPDLGDGR